MNWSKFFKTLPIGGIIIGTLTLIFLELETIANLMNSEIIMCFAPVIVAFSGILNYKIAKDDATKGYLLGINIALVIAAAAPLLYSFSNLVTESYAVAAYSFSIAILAVILNSKPVIDYLDNSWAWIHK